MNLDTASMTMANLVDAYQQQAPRVRLPDQPEMAMDFFEALQTMERVLATLATAEGGRGPIPIAINTARTSLGGAIALLWLDGRSIAATHEQVLHQLRLCAGYLVRAQRGGVPVGTG